jgi:hypothetical protein
MDAVPSDPDSFRIQFAGRDSVQTGTFEPDEITLIRHHLNDADVFVDMGANIGYFAYRKILKDRLPPSFSE